MKNLNLLWPAWAELVSHRPVGTLRSMSTLLRAGVLLGDRYRRFREARFAHDAWESLRASRRFRETWARPRPFLRTLVLLAIAFGLSSTPSTAAPNDEAADGGRLYGILGYAMFAGAAGDLASTEYLLANGAYEFNPLQRNRGVRIGSTVAFPVAMNYLSEELRKDGHPKMALWMRIAVVGLKGYAIVHNLRQR